ncbi:MAG TPA: serine hydrolase [Syntrophales bacterium]|nr:serine hydrolase [Syntrophales bacterium]
MNLKRFTLYLCLLVVTFFFFHSELNAAPRGKLRAKAAILMNIDSGSILYTKNPNKPMQPASLTKILSLYLVYEAINEGKVHLTDKVKISTDAQLTGGSSMYLVDETEVALEDLIKGMAVVSANDASIAIAEYIGGSVNGFVNMMNANPSSIISCLM